MSGAKAQRARCGQDQVLANARSEEDKMEKPGTEAEGTSDCPARPGWGWQGAAPEWKSLEASWVCARWLQSMMLKKQSFINSALWVALISANWRRFTSLAN